MNNYFFHVAKNNNFVPAMGMQMPIRKHVVHLKNLHAVL